MQDRTVKNWMSNLDLLIARYAGGEKRRKEEGTFIRSLWAILQGMESEDPKAFDDYSRYGDFFETEISLRESHLPAVDRWFSRLEVGEVEFGNPELTSELIFLDSEGNESTPPSFDKEMDNEWWEGQFSQDPKLCIKKLDDLGQLEEAFWLPNRDHLNTIAERREETFQSLLIQIQQAQGIPALKRLVGRAKFLSAQAGFGIKGNFEVKEGVSISTMDDQEALDYILDQEAGFFSLEKKTLGAGLDYARYAQVMNLAAKRACLCKKFLNASQRISQLFYSEKEKEAKSLATSLNKWLSKNLPGFKVFPVKVYEKEEKDGEDIYDHGARKGEFHCDTPQPVPCKCQGGLLPNGEICPVCGGYGEGFPHTLKENLALLRAEHHRLNRVRKPKIQSWGLPWQEICDWVVKYFFSTFRKGVNPSHDKILNRSGNCYVLDTFC